MPAITVTPASASITVRRSITLSGFPPNAFVTLHAEACWADGSVWSSHNTYFSNGQGIVDLDDTCPLEGSYSCIDAMGPVWSMVCNQPDTVQFPPQDTTAIRIMLTAQHGDLTARATLTQSFLPEGVIRRSVAEEGIVGELFLPPGDGPHPAIVFMNGSSGGIDPPRAALFAAQGYACLALGLFGVDGRPRYLNDMPLEYCHSAISWLRTNIKPRNDFVAVAGVSRGGEFSLLVAASFPEAVSAVIAYVPSVLLHGTVSAGRPEDGRNAAAWMLDGLAVPHLWEDNPEADWDISLTMPPPIRQSYAFSAAMKHPASFDRACIPVEKIAAPVLLISACDDGFWPSTTYCNIVEEKIRASNSFATVRHVACDGAGHNIYYPYLPTTIIAKPHAVSRVVLSGGGDPRSNALANVQAYDAVNVFLAEVSERPPAPLSLLSAAGG